MITRRSALLSLVSLAARPWRALAKPPAPVSPYRETKMKVYWLIERGSVYVDEETAAALAKLAESHPDFLKFG